MTMDGAVVVPATSQGAQWVDEVLLAGPASDICFRLPDPIDRAKLRQLVRDRECELADAGFRAGGAAALRLPPSMAFVTHLLAVWRSGGQAILLDHRLTDCGLSAVGRGGLLIQACAPPACLPVAA